ncbi:MAG: hypothetical protein K0S11_29, partial [Gammaproteobacteria bacterium]|nr:hypothetical protein [Gammaproteobacteria bacterium]
MKNFSRLLGLVLILLLAGCATTPVKQPIKDGPLNY